MHVYETINRLQADQWIGRRHICVERHFTQGYPQHWHNYFELELILSGSGFHVYNGTECSVSKGDAYLLTPVDFHGIEGNVELLNISFDEVLLPEEMLSFLADPKAEKMCRFSQEEFQRFCEGARLLEYESLSDGPCAPQLLEYLLSCFVRKTDHRAERLPKVQLQGIQKAISHIELHFREQVTLAQLAALSGYNPSYFSELFRKVTGQTYKERIRDLRINYAKMLLANGLTVSEACFASGFGSLSNFTSSFREKCGMSPRDFRSIMAKQQK